MACPSTSENLSFQMGYNISRLSCARSFRSPVNVLQRCRWRFLKDLMRSFTYSFTEDAVALTTTHRSAHCGNMLYLLQANLAIIFRNVSIPSPPSNRRCADFHASRSLSALPVLTTVSRHHHIHFDFRTCSTSSKKSTKFTLGLCGNVEHRRNFYTVDRRMFSWKGCINSGE